MNPTDALIVLALLALVFEVVKHLVSQWQTTTQTYLHMNSDWLGANSVSITLSAPWKHPQNEQLTTGRSDATQLNWSTFQNKRRTTCTGCQNVMRSNNIARANKHDNDTRSQNASASPHTCIQMDKPNTHTHTHTHALPSWWILDSTLDLQHQHYIALLKHWQYVSKFVSNIWDTARDEYISKLQNLFFSKNEMLTRVSALLFLKK